jgi:hypothetical protein
MDLPPSTPLELETVPDVGIDAGNDQDARVDILMTVTAQHHAVGGGPLPAAAP